MKTILQARVFWAAISKRVCPAAERVVLYDSQVDGGCSLDDGSITWGGKAVQEHLTLVTGLSPDGAQEISWPCAEGKAETTV